jgi:hypothetical protein
MSTKTNTEKEKIHHPFRVPDNFFDDFKTGILETVSTKPEEKQVGIIRLVKKITVYAAILVFGFFAVKGIVFTFQNKSPDLKSTDAEIDAIYTQISEEDLTNFMLDESNVELTEILDF